MQIKLVMSIHTVIYKILFYRRNILYFNRSTGVDLFIFLPASPKAKAGQGVQSLRPSVRTSVPKSCHRNFPETTYPIIMKLGM